MLNQNCSVIIPTYNRPQYLARTIRFFSTYGRNFPIIIADSGSQATQIANKETVASCSSLDITHRAYPDSPEPFGNFESKIADALDHSHTKYCVISPDDDFLAPTAISACANFLKHHPDFAVAHGEYMRYWAGSKPRCLNWRPVYEGRSLTYSEPEVRLQYHLSHYPTDTTYYAVHRLALLKHVLGEVVKSGLQLTVFRELYATGITVIHGKTRYLNLFYCAKDLSSERTQHVPDARSLSGTPAYLCEQKMFTQLLVRYLHEHANLSPEKSVTTVDNAVSGYFDRALHSNPPRLEKTIISTREILYAKKAGWLYDYVKRAYRKIFPRDIYSTTRGQLWIMLKGQLDWINYKDFKTITDFVA